MLMHCLNGKIQKLIAIGSSTKGQNVATEQFINEEFQWSVNPVVATIYDSEHDTYYSRPDNKKMLAEFLAFADTGLADFQLEKRSGDVEVTSQHGLYKDGENIGKTDLPLKEESFGTRALFIIGCHILQALQSGSPFFVDEMDSGLHSYITQLIVDIFRNGRINKKDAQLVFTTHDVNLLDQNTIRKDQVWFTEKDKFGVSEMFTLSDFDDVREDTLFAKWYLNNKFGGVPSLQSLEKLFVEDGKK